MPSRQRHPKAVRGQLRERLQSQPALFVLLAVFVGLIAIFGGGARPDIFSLVLLRPLAIAMAGLALYLAPPRQWGIQPVVWVVFAVAISAVGWQLVPLPPSIWRTLPGRDIVAEVDALVGMGQVWRPAALSPAGAWNALFAVAVGGSAVAVAGASGPAARAKVPVLWLCVAAASALLGIAQLVVGAGSPLYTYAITNDGLPVGLFANANHQAVLMAASLPVAAVWSGMHRARRSTRWPAAVGLMLLFSIVALLAESRAGYGLLLFGLVISAAVMVRSHMATSNGGIGRFAYRLSGLVNQTSLALFAVLVVCSVALLDRVGVIDVADLLAAQQDDEIRFQALPTIFEMWRVHWLSGTGGGGFDNVYKTFEPVELLSRLYLNQAHNDWLQVPIEYGIGGVVLLIAFVAANVAALRAAFARNSDPVMRAALAAPTVILALSSLVDYPLRTPFMAGLFIIWVVSLPDFASALNGGVSGRARG